MGDAPRAALHVPATPKPVVDWLGNEFGMLYFAVAVVGVPLTFYYKKRHAIWPFAISAFTGMPAAAMAFIWSCARYGNYKYSAAWQAALDNIPPEELARNQKLLAAQQRMQQMEARRPSFMEELPRPRAEDIDDEE